MKPILTTLLLFTLFYGASAQDLNELNNKADSLTELKKYDDALLVYSKVINSPLNDVNAIDVKAFALYGVALIYNESDFNGQDIVKSYVYFQKAINKLQEFITVESQNKYKKDAKKFIEAISKVCVELKKSCASCTFDIVNNKEYDNVIYTATVINNKSNNNSINTEYNNTKVDETPLAKQSLNAGSNATPKTDDKTVTLTVTGQGKTIEEAKQNALRSAIEQAFGTFISSNTTILNDKLIKDEIISVTNGNIQKYDVLNETPLPDGSYATILKAIVSVNKLTGFCISKGVTVEFKGGLFAMNIALQELNEQNEIKAWNNILNLLKNNFNNFSQYNLTTKNPQLIEKDIYNIPVTIVASLNNNFDLISSLLINFLKSASLSNEEVENYKNINKKTYVICVSKIENDKFSDLVKIIGYGGEKLYQILEAYTNKYFLRNKSVASEILDLPRIVSALLATSFKINNGISNYALDELLSDKDRCTEVLINFFPISKVDFYIWLFSKRRNGYWNWTEFDNILSQSRLGDNHQNMISIHKYYTKLKIKDFILSYRTHSHWYDIDNAELESYFPIYLFNKSKYYLEISYKEKLSIDEIKKITEYKLITNSN